MKTWTEREIRFLQKAYNNEPIAKIAKALLRSEQSIRNKVHIMRKKGLRFDRKRDIREKNWAQEQHENKIFNDNAEKNFFKGEHWVRKYE
jgi:transposase